MINGLDAELFKTCFTNWVEALRDGAPDLIAGDGKTSRRSHARGQGREPLHLVSAWAARQRLVLGQEATHAKSNEITAIPLLLERLELTGALVTIDAMGAHTEIAETIVERGGDYLLALKANRPATSPRSSASLPIRRPSCARPPSRPSITTMAASKSAVTASAMTWAGWSPTAAIPASRAFRIWP